MLSHERVWAAIDALAARYSLSASGLAKRAGLDFTAFNKSKRQSVDGRPRWPSTEIVGQDHRGDGFLARRVHGPDRRQVAAPGLRALPVRAPCR